MFSHKIRVILWKFQVFSIIQILREINFSYSDNPKSAILDMIDTKCEIFIKIEIQSLKNCKHSRFFTSRIPKIDFTLSEIS